MYAIEFNATIMDGKIEIPVQYMKQLASPNNVKVILMQKDFAQTGKASGATDNDFGFGLLSRYANPALWEQESGAWERAAVEKYEAN